MGENKSRLTRICLSGYKHGYAVSSQIVQGVVRSDQAKGTGTSPTRRTLRMQSYGGAGSVPVHGLQASGPAQGMWSGPGQTRLLSGPTIDWQDPGSSLHRKVL